MFKAGFKKLIADFTLIVPFVLFLFFRLDGIFNDMSNSDAARWHRRSERFATAIKQMDFAQTYTSYHPGVTLMWITSATETGLKGYFKLINTEYKTLENTDGYMLIDGISKIVLVIILFSLLLLQFKYIDTLFDREVAFLYVLLVALEPYYIGINRWYHLTSLEVSLTFTAFLSLLIWSEFKQSSLLIKSGLLYGLAILTKFSSLILSPVFAFVFLASASRDINLPKSYYAKALIKFGVVVILTIFVMFPALWVNGVEVVSKLISAGNNAADGAYHSVVFAEQKPWLYYLISLAFKLSPITLLIFLVALFKSIVWKERLLSYIIIYITFAFMVLSISEQKIERYILTFIPAILLLCAITLSRLGTTFRFTAFVAISFFMLLVYTNFHPLYSGYYSPLLGGPKEAYKINLYDDNGEYFYRVANYLNQKGRDINVYVPFNVESYSYYFKGNLQDRLDPSTNYVVLSNDSRRPFMPNSTMYRGCSKLEKVFYNYNLPVVEIYQCSNIIPDLSTPYD